MKRDIEEPNLDLGAGEVLTSYEIAEYLNCHVTTVYRLVKRGLPVFRLGKDLRFKFADINAWIAAGHMSSNANPGRRKKRPRK